MTAPAPISPPVTVARRVAGVALLSPQAGRLAEFYRDALGLGLERRLHGDGREHHIAQLADVHVEIKATRTPEGQPTPDAIDAEALGTQPTAELSMQVDDVDAAVQQVIAAGGRLHTAAGDYSWGRYAITLDPDGNRLGLYSPPAAATHHTTQEEHA